MNDDDGLRVGMDLDLNNVIFTQIMILYFTENKLFVCSSFVSLFSLLSFQTIFS